MLYIPLVSLFRTRVRAHQERLAILALIFYYTNMKLHSLLYHPATILAARFTLIHVAFRSPSSFTETYLTLNTNNADQADLFVGSSASDITTPDFLPYPFDLIRHPSLILSSGLLSKVPCPTIWATAAL